MRREITSLNIIRGLAALAVCVTHLRGAIIVDYASIEHTSILHKLFYFLTGLGHQAVLIFFVLSGYLIAISIYGSTTFSFFNYLTRRLIRLWIVLIPALALTFLVNYYLEINNPEVLLGKFFSVWHSGPDQNYSNSLKTLLINIIFQQGILSPVYAGNNPLWSLANEFWYYVLFGIVCSIYFCNNRSKYFKGLIIILILYYLPVGIILYFFAWFSGAALARLNFGNRNRVIVKAHKYISITFLIISLIYSKLVHFDIGFIFSEIAICLSVIYVIFAYDNFSFKKLKIINTFFKFLSDISYTLYLTHFPLVMLISIIFYEGVKIKLEIASFLWLLVWMLFLLTSAILFWYFFERNTDRVRRIIQNR